MYHLSRSILGLRSTRNCRLFSYYISTPIFYANSSPHIGHVYTAVLADAINRYQRLKLNRNDTIFSTGTDEHGLKIQIAAESEGKNYSKFCDENSGKFKTLFDFHELSYSDFVRTTEDRHRNAVVSLWNELDKKGCIYKDIYSGWYSTADEAFVPESQVITGDDGSHVDQKNSPLVWSSEENYMFRLSEFKSKLKDWLKEENPIRPRKFNDLALSMLDDNLSDLSISRPKHRLSWGIPVPNDPSQTIYVWLDALTSYLTVVDYPNPPDKLKRWPVDCQVIGKDIIKFHAVYWPAFLMALSLPLPKKLVCHSHWLLKSQKMSKSTRNVVDPAVEALALTKEGLRYYLLKAGTLHSDVDYDREQALRRVNSELSSTYGNLFSRCCSPQINPSRTIPTMLVEGARPELLEFIERLDGLRQVCEVHYEEANIYKAIDEIMEVLRLSNSLYEATQPWRMVSKIESETDKRRDYNNVQAVTFEALRITSILLRPVVPRLSELALDWMQTDRRTWADAQVSLDGGDSASGTRPLQDIPEYVLFRRIKV